MSGYQAEQVTESVEVLLNRHADAYASEAARRARPSEVARHAVSSAFAAAVTDVRLIAQLACITDDPEALRLPHARNALPSRGKRPVTPEAPHT